MVVQACNGREAGAPLWPSLRALNVHRPINASGSAAHKTSLATGRPTALNSFLCQRLIKFNCKAASTWSLERRNPWLRLDYGLSIDFLIRPTMDRINWAESYWNGNSQVSTFLLPGKEASQLVILFHPLLGMKPILDFQYHGIAQAPFNNWRKFVQIKVILIFYSCNAISSPKHPQNVYLQQQSVEPSWLFGTTSWLVAYMPVTRMHLSQCTPKIRSWPEPSHCWLLWDRVDWIWRSSRLPTPA